MSMATEIAKRSKDPSTQVGAILVSPDRKHISLGYNGMPTNYPENEAIWERPTKYDYVVHAEVNAVLNCDFPTIGCTLYVTGVPCNDCAKFIAQAGITRIVYRDHDRESSLLKYNVFFEICRTLHIELKCFDLAKEI